MSDDHDAMLQPDFLEGLEQRPMEWVRAVRTESVEVETGLSYLRRMVQGPLDIVNREIGRRAHGSSTTDLATLVAELPETLGDSPRAGGVGRLSQTLEPTRVDPALEHELDTLVGGGRLAAVTGMTDDELTDLADRLRAFESRVSARRQDYFTLIDRLQAELARRYRSGEASVDALLEG